MKRVLSLFILLGFMLGVFSNANAETVGKKYAGADLMVVNASAGDDDVTVSVLAGKFGYYVHENLAVEGRLGIGITDDEIGYYDTEVRINYALGVYLLPEYSNNKFKLYGILGMTRGESEVGDETFDNTDLSYGFGAKYMITETVAVGAEYIFLMEDDNDVDYESIGVGAAFYF
jgi:hypothetical protein